MIFQDFVKYQLTIRENIGFGSVTHLHDPARINQAAAQGGADSIVAQFAEGLETTLGGWFLDGKELSGGQWQKLRSRGRL